ncbi:urokinase plasminogen activator surface receptor-like isoform X3 [Arapaima gigas]
MSGLCFCSFQRLHFHALWVYNFWPPSNFPCESTLLAPSTRRVDKLLSCTIRLLSEQQTRMKLLCLTCLLICTAYSDGRKCYGCKDVSCSHIITCKGDEDHCITARMEDSSIATAVKGCATRDMYFSSEGTDFTRRRASPASSGWSGCLSFITQNRR